jgi:hypothetical protein
MKNHSQKSQSPDRDLNPEPPKHEAGVLAKKARCKCKRHLCGVQTRC